MTWPHILRSGSARDAFEQCASTRHLGFIVNAYVDNGQVTTGNYQAVIRSHHKGKDRPGAKRLRLNLGQVAYRIRVWPKRRLTSKDYRDGLNART